MRQLPQKVSSTRPDTANAQWMVVAIVLARVLIIRSDFRAMGLNVTACLSLPHDFRFVHGCAWGLASVNDVSPEGPWRKTHHRTHALEPVLFDGHYVSWPCFFLANSKSEGSPMLPHEPSKGKPEESRDVTRPSRPAVSTFLSKNSKLSIYQRTHRTVVGRTLLTVKQTLWRLIRRMMLEASWRKSCLIRKDVNRSWITYRLLGICGSLANNSDHSIIPTQQLWQKDVELAVKDTWALCMGFSCLFCPFHILFSIWINIIIFCCFSCL